MTAVTNNEALAMQPIKSSGIKLKFDPAHGWIATVEFSTEEHATETCIEGSIGVRYFNQDLGKAIQLALVAAKTIGVSFHDGLGLEPSLYVEGDGEDPSVPLPTNWRQLIAEQSARLGWKSASQVELQAMHEAPSRVH
jgi:hypothetical protein